MPGRDEQDIFHFATIWVYKTLSIDVWNLESLCINITNKIFSMSMNLVCAHYQNQSLAFVKNAQLSPRSKYVRNKVLQIIKHLK